MSIQSKSIKLFGGFVRWALTSWFTKKSLNQYYENAEGTEDSIQSWVNLFVGIITVVLIISIITYLLRMNRYSDLPRDPIKIIPE